jgi:hypothetical protein
MTLVQVLLILIGLFTAAGGVFGWDWFLRHWKSRLFVEKFGKVGARVFYVVFGLAIVGVGFFLL